MRRLLTAVAGLAGAACVLSGCAVVNIGGTSGCQIISPTITTHGGSTMVAWDMTCSAHPYHVHGSIILQYIQGKMPRWETLYKQPITADMLPPADNSKRAYGFTGPCAPHSRERLWADVFSTWRTGPDQVRQVLPLTGTVNFIFTKSCK